MSDSEHVDTSAPLALEARTEHDGQGWTISLPVRSEHVRVDKRVVVAERVVVRTHQTTDVERIDTTVRRERLRVDIEGDLDTTEPLERR
jgi:uncharacterized protein (TIGR02271 family)